MIQSIKQWVLRKAWFLLFLAFLFLLMFTVRLGQNAFTASKCHRMQRFAMAGFPPTLSERIECEDVGVKVILVPNETTE